MIRTTNWHPDTCSNPPCIVAYTWDDSIDQSSRTHTVSDVLRRCSRHAASFTGGPALFAQLLDENPRKNKLLDRARTQFPAAFDASGNFLGSWSFDSAHVLHVTIPGLPGAQKSTIQTWCDTNLGLGKVVVA